MKYQADSFKIKEDLYCLGPQFLPVYLLDGPEPVLFDAGMSFVAEYYETELQKILGSRPLKYLLLSHMHFDHCGAAGYLKRLYPELIICSAVEGAKIIEKPSALNLINQLSGGSSLPEKQKFVPFQVDKTLKNGEELFPGNRNVIKTIASPGHTRDLLSFYLPLQKVLIPSEAAGVPAHDDYVYSEFLVDCQVYFQSLQRLSQFEFDTILFAHNYVYTDSDADTFIDHAIALGYKFRDRLLELLNQYGEDLDAICQAIKSEEYDQIKEPKQPETAYLINLKAKINAVDQWRKSRENDSILPADSSHAP